MKSIQQPDLSIPGTLTNQPLSVYVPPEVKAVDQFAKDVCQRLSQQGILPDMKPEIVTGLASFLNYIAQLEAKRLSQLVKVK